MTVDRLILNEITADRFGGLTDSRVVLPSDDFVVLHGGNESGKSTLTQLLAWLLVGPYGPAENAQRFGDPDDKIGGSLTGQLGSQEFTAKGAFRVLKSGAPNANGLTVDLGRPLNADQWRSELGGIDGTVLDRIYRLWGEQLHEVGGVELELDAARGVSAATPNVREMLKELKDLSAKAAGRSGSQPDSCRQLRSEIAEKKDALRAAEGNADQHAKKEEELNGLESEQRKLRSVVNEARAKSAVITTVIGTTEQAGKIAKLRAELESLPDVPAHWMTFAEDPEVIRSCVEALENAEADVERAEGNAELVASALGTTWPELVDVVVTESNLAEATRLTTQLGAADEELAQAESLETDRKNEASTAEQELEQALHELGGNATASPSLRDVSVQSDIKTAIATWKQAADADKEQQRSLELVASKKKFAEDHLADRQAAWSEHRTGRTAIEWMQERGTATSAPSASMGASWWLVPAIVALLAIAAAALGQWLLAAGAGVAALVALASHLRSPAGTHSAGNPIAAQETLEAAQAVQDAQTAAQAARDELRSEEVAYKAAMSTERLKHEELADLISLHGFEDPLNPASCELEFERRVALATKQHLATEAKNALEAATAAVANAQANVAERENALEEIPKSCGITSTVKAREVEQQLRAYRDAAAEAHNANERAASLGEHRSRLNDLLEPVQTEIEDWRRGRIVEHAQQHAETLRRRRELEERVNQEESLFKVMLGDDLAVVELSEQKLPSSTLATQLAEAEADVAAADQNLAAVQEQIGALRKDLADLAKVEETVALRLEIGALEERLQERAGDSAAAALAHDLLRDASDRYVRENQPGIVKRASELACATNDLWSQIAFLPHDEGKSPLVVRQGGARDVPATKLSTAARGLLYLAFRIAIAEHDAERRNIRLPLLCDDPLVHFDDQRAEQALALLKEASAAGHQVLLFTCHERTVNAAKSAGAIPVEIGT